MSRYEDQLAALLQSVWYFGFEPPERQYRFAAPLRQYRIDFAWPGFLVAVEVDGGTFVGRGGSGPLVRRTIPVGQHQTVEDYRKKNLLNMLGWTVLSYRPEQLTRLEALVEIQLALLYARDKTRITIDDEALKLLAERQTRQESAKRKVKAARYSHRDAMNEINREASKALKAWGREKGYRK